MNRGTSTGSGGGTQDGLMVWRLVPTWWYTAALHEKKNNHEQLVMA